MGFNSGFKGLIWTILPTDCRCTGLFLYLITLNDKYIHSVGLLWTRDQPVAETSTWQHTTVTWDIHSTGGIWTRNPSKRLAADLNLRQRGHRDRSLLFLLPLNCFASVLHHQYYHLNLPSGLSLPAFPVPVWQIVPIFSEAFLTIRGTSDSNRDLLS